MNSDEVLKVDSSPKIEFFSAIVKSNTCKESVSLSNLEIQAGMQNFS